MISMMNDMFFSVGKHQNCYFLMFFFLKIQVKYGNINMCMNMFGDGGIHRAFCSPWKYRTENLFVSNACIIDM